MDLEPDRQDASDVRPEPVVGPAEFDDMADRCIVRATRKAANLLTRAYNIQLREAGLEATQFWTLAAIAEGRAGSATELARSLGVEKSTLKRSLDLLEKAGLIEAAAGAGRRITHRLTEAGRGKLDAAIPLWRQTQADFARFLPQGRPAELRAGLDLLRGEAQRIAETASSD